MSLDSLNAQQLTAVKKQLDEEVEHLTTSFAQLQAAQIKFRDCLRCVKTQGTSQGEPATWQGRRWSGEKRPRWCSMMSAGTASPVLTRGGGGQLTNDIFTMGR